MVRRGPNPEPTAIRLLKDERHQDRLNHHEPVPVAEMPEPPSEMAAPVAEVWTRAVLALADMGLARGADADVLRCYVEAVWTHQRACAILRQSGVLVQGTSGNLITNPALRVQRDAATTIRMFAAEFGFSPSARTRIEVGGDPSPEDNPFAG